MKKRAFAAALAALVLLPGCGRKEDPDSAGLYERASGIAPEAVLATVDGREVPAARYFYWLAADCGYLAEQAGGVPDWSAAAGERTLDEYVKAQALDAAVFYATVENWADQNGCALTAGDLAAMDDDWTAGAEVYGGEDAYLAALADLGLDRAGAQLLCADYYLYEQLRALSREPDGPLAPGPGEVTACAEAAGLFTVETLRFLDEGDAGAALKTLQSDPSADPEKLAKAGSADHRLRTAAPGGGALPEAVEAARTGLADGAWSAVTAADGDFWILRNAPLDGPAAADHWFDVQLQTAADGAEVVLSKAYGGFTAASFYEGLCAARAS